MKKAFLLSSLLISSTVLAHPFILDATTRMANLSNCQKNHNMILNKNISVADSQIERLTKGIEEEERISTHNYQLSAYKKLLGNIVIKRIILNELKKQLNSRNLNQFYTTKENYNKAFLNPDVITVDLEKEFKTTMKEVLYSQRIMFTENMIDNIKQGVMEDIGKQIISSKFRSVGAGVFTKIVAGQAIKISAKSIGKVSISFGSKLFVSAIKGSLLTIAVMPLQAYRLPPETEWTDLLEKYPEVIMVPEWMRKGRIHDHPWYTHCNAIQRRTKLMDAALTKVLKAEEKDFISQVIRIDQMDRELEEAQAKPKDSWREPPRAFVDNTYVYRPKPMIDQRPPFWAIKRN